MKISRNETDNTKSKSFKKFLIVGGVVEAHFCVQLKVRPARVVSQAQFQIGAAPQKAENRSKIGATSRGVPQKAENRSKIGATSRGGE